MVSPVFPSITSAPLNKPQHEVTGAHSQPLRNPEARHPLSKPAALPFPVRARTDFRHRRKPAPGFAGLLISLDDKVQTCMSDMWPSSSGYFLVHSGSIGITRGTSSEEESDTADKDQK